MLGWRPRGWGDGVQICFWTREDDRRVFFPSSLSLVFGEEERDGKRREQKKKNNLYLEQLRRPGAEAVCLSQVEGPEIRVEWLVDLGVWKRKAGGEGRKNRGGERGRAPRDFRERCKKEKKDEDEKREREIKKPINPFFSPAPCRSSRSGSPSRAWRRRMRPHRGRRRAGNGS